MQSIFCRGVYLAKNSSQSAARIICSPIGEQIMRAADCKPFVKKGPYPFLTVSGGAGPQAPPHQFLFPGA